MCPGSLNDRTGRPGGGIMSLTGIDVEKLVYVRFVIWPFESKSPTHSPLNLRRLVVSNLIWRPWIVAGFFSQSVESSIAFFLEHRVKMRYFFIRTPSFP